MNVSHKLKALVGAQLSIYGPTAAVVHLRPSAAAAIHLHSSHTRYHKLVNRGPQNGPALVFPLTLHLAPVHCHLHHTCAAHVQPPVLVGVRYSHTFLPPPNPRTAAVDAVQAQEDLEADRSAWDKQGWPQVVAQLSM
ncbi:hypothetical protein B0H14DRAFT_2577263 [Mycena olivaceomarginata]|nr:hypothetical protein B0H14DRAFT_2577263 [Mycena olivaceomarginata]